MKHTEQENSAKRDVDQKNAQLAREQGVPSGDEKDAAQKNEELNKDQRKND